MNGRAPVQCTCFTTLPLAGCNLSVRLLSQSTGLFLSGWRLRKSLIFPHLKSHVDYQEGKFASLGAVRLPDVCQSIFSMLQAARDSFKFLFASSYLSLGRGGGRLCLNSLPVGKMMKPLVLFGILRVCLGFFDDSLPGFNGFS